MVKYNFESAMVLWLQGENIGREGWDDQALACHWDWLTDEDKLAEDYIIFKFDENEFELIHDPNDYEYSEEELGLLKEELGLLEEESRLLEEESRLLEEESRLLKEELGLLELWDKELEEGFKQWKEEKELKKKNLEELKKEFLENQIKLWDRYTNEIIKTIYGEEF